MTKDLSGPKCNNKLWNYECGMNEEVYCPKCKTKMVKNYETLAESMQINRNVYGAGSVGVGDNQHDSDR